MGRLQNVEEVYSALYIDFDNIYTRLSEQDPALARTFATNPQRWMRWIEGHALRMMYGDGVRRRILKKCCYLNPHRYHEFRPFFIRAAFQVVDCPPLTNYGKTSADIHLVMDCMDALAHVTRFDEIIILSGDADFTPLLLRIQEHARRSIVLSVGYTSPAYVAACSWRIREDWFIAQALEEIREDYSEYARLPESRTPEARSTEGRIADNKTDDGRSRRPASDRRPEEVYSSQSYSQLPAGKRMRIIETIKQLVAEANTPIPLFSVAQILQYEQGLAADSFGSGTLREFLQTLDLTPIEFSPTGPGYVFDPQRHNEPLESAVRDDFKQRMPLLYELAVKVHQLTDIPLLHPETYARLIALLEGEVRKHGVSRIETVAHIEERCKEESLPISLTQIAFVMEAVIRGGLTLTDPAVAANATAATICNAFYQRAVELCRLSQISLTENDMQLLESWLLRGGFSKEQLP